MEVPGAPARSAGADPAPASASGRPMLRLALTGLAGTSVEWFDFYLYGVAAALVFPALYFPPTLSRPVALMASFGTFAVGFFARPVGAVLFGHVGDRLGRRAALAAALALMGTATALIGCLPAYATLGALAPALLVALRLAQGLAIGGQWGGAMLLVLESAPPTRRGYYSSFAQVGAPVGVVAANFAFLLASALTTPAQFLSWGWRVPFVLSLSLVGFARYVHRRVEESPEFRRQAAAASTRSPVLEALRAQPREILLAAGAYLAVQVSFYVSITWAVAYGSDAAGLALPRTTMLAAVLVASAVSAPALVCFGALSDRYGRRRLYLCGAVLMAAWAFAFLPLIETRVAALITLAICGTQLINAMMYGPQAALFGELFRTRVRYTGASLGYQLGSAVGGALAPLVAEAIVSVTHATFGISVYIALACAITVGSVASLSRSPAGFQDPAP